MDRRLFLKTTAAVGGTFLLQQSRGEVQSCRPIGLDSHDYLLASDREQPPHSVSPNWNKSAAGSLRLMSLSTGQISILPVPIDPEPTNLVYLDFQTGHVKHFLDGQKYQKSEIRGEGLSLCWLNDSKVAMSMPVRQQVAIWDFQSNELEFRSFNTPVTGIAKYGNQVFVNTDWEGLARLDPNMNLPAIPLHYHSFATGSHLRLLQV